MITLLSFILLFSQGVASQKGTNPAIYNEHPTTRFLQTIYTDPNFNYSGAIIVKPPIIVDPNRFVDPNDANYVYTIDPNLKDPYEPDDDPNQANPIVISEFSNQFHTFHNKHDIDWVYLYGTEGESYSFNPESANEECLVLMTLYDIMGK